MSAALREMKKKMSRYFSYFFFQVKLWPSCICNLKRIWGARFATQSVSVKRGMHEGILSRIPANIELALLGKNVF